MNFTSYQSVFRFLSGFVLLFILSCRDYQIKDSEKSQEKFITKEILVLNEVCTIQIFFEKDSEEKAIEVLRYTEKYIPAIADYLQIKPLKTNFVFRQAHDPVHLSQNKGKQIELFFHSEFLPELIYYEVSRWWFSQGQEWISEGVSSFLPLAMSLSGNLDLSQAEKEKIMEHWKLRIEKEDLQNYSKFHETNKPEKYFKTQVILHSKLGNTNYRDFLLTLIGGPGNVSEDWVLKDRFVMRSNASILSLLEQYEKVKWDSYLSGWAYPGKFKEIKPEMFTQVNPEGELIALVNQNSSLKNSEKENLDTLDDLSDLNAQFDSLDFETGEKISLGGITLDGLLDDWERESEKKNYINPDSSEKEFKINEFNYLQKEDKLILGIKVSISPVFDFMNVRFQLRITDPEKSKECRIQYIFLKQKTKFKCRNNEFDSVQVAFRKGFEIYIMSNHFGKKLVVTPSLIRQKKEIPIYLKEKHFILKLD
ncbi:MAG: hypothetical protein KDK54_19060 [Leptospiraceae bacterium]|nr:hypothetical protein [Leptospiraceae bacterium]